MTTLYVTHDQTEAMTLGDRIAVLAGGRLQQVGTPLEIYDHPANPFVARFVGSPPMNLLAGRVVHSTDGSVFDTGSLTVQLRRPLPPAMARAAAGRCLLGIRPEHLRLVPPGAGDCTVAIGLREKFGAESLHYVFLEETTLVVRTTTRWDAPSAGLEFPPEHMHIFPAPERS